MRYLLTLMMLLCTTSFADNGAVVSIDTKEQALKEIAKPGPMVVMYEADWCGACQSFIVEYFDAAARMPEVRFYLVNVDHGIGYKEHAKLIHCIPTVLVGKDETSLRNHPCEIAKGKRDSATVRDEIKRCLK